MTGVVKCACRNVPTDTRETVAETATATKILCSKVWSFFETYQITSFFQCYHDGGPRVTGVVKCACRNRVSPGETITTRYEINAIERVNERAEIKELEEARRAVR